MVRTAVSASHQTDRPLANHPSEKPVSDEARVVAEDDHISREDKAGSPHFKSLTFSYRGRHAATPDSNRHGVFGGAVGGELEESVETVAIHRGWHLRRNRIEERILPPRIL
ncbi:MAG: hypothetical protein HYU52_01510 [Acidobacteria bacterium]|nr:hypothetical protein [Acidobacteriota bacterium]